MQRMLDRYSRQFGFQYGIQPVAEAAAHLDDADAFWIEQELSAEEMAQFARFKVPKRKVEWLAGRMAAKAAFKKYARFTQRMGEPGISVFNDAQRAPCIAGHPELTLSITHSQAYALAVVAPFPIGIDLEMVEPRPAALAQYFCAPSEWAWLADPDPLAGEARFYLASGREDCGGLARPEGRLTWLWTRKEAVSKFLRLGGSLAFNQVNVLPDVVQNQEWKAPIQLLSGFMQDPAALAWYCLSCALPERLPGEGYVL